MHLFFDTLWIKSHGQTQETPIIRRSKIAVEYFPCSFECSLSTNTPYMTAECLETTPRVQFNQNSLNGVLLTAIYIYKQLVCFHKNIWVTGHAFLNLAIG